jgi:hypothetical protein
VITDSIACSQCGAISSSETACRECFEALLAFENERPKVFAAVHHLTVAAYYLQHPAGYAHSVLDAWRSLLADSLDGKITPASLRQTLGRQFAGSKRVREPDATPPEWWPSEWTVRVQDVFNPVEPLPTESEYVSRAIAWAKATREKLDESQARGLK